MKNSKFGLLGIFLFILFIILRCENKNTNSESENKKENIGNIQDQIDYIYKENGKDIPESMETYIDKEKNIKPNLSKNQLENIQSELKLSIKEKDKKLVTSINTLSNEERNSLLNKNDSVKKKIDIDSDNNVSDISKLNIKEKSNLKKDTKFIQKNKYGSKFYKKIQTHFAIIDNDEYLKSKFPKNKDEITDSYISNLNNKVKYKVNQRLDNFIMLYALEDHYDIIKTDKLLYDKCDIIKILKLNIDENNITYDKIANLDSKEKNKINKLLKKLNNYETIYNKKYKISFGYFSTEGTYRDHMEDSEIYAKSPDGKIIIFGVFDGHGGDQVAKYIKKNFASFLFEKLKKLDINDIKNLNSNLDKIIKKAYLEFDKDLYYKLKNNRPGSTAIVALIVNDNIFLINLGDSRGLIIKNKKIIKNTIDHKPDDKNEKKRIEKANGFIEYTRGTWRVDGKLAVSRAIGDFSLKLKNKKYDDKTPHVSPIPKVYKKVNMLNNKTDEYYMVLACDGVWDELSNEQVLNIINKNKSKTEKQLADKIVNTALQKGSSDNVTAMVIKVKPY